MDLSGLTSRIFSIISHSTVEQLRAAVLDAWEQLPTEDIDGHIWKMGDHVEAVLAAKGGHTAF